MGSAVLAVLLFTAVLAVPQQGVTSGGQLGPNLMGAPGDQVALEQGQAVACGQGRCV